MKIALLICGQMRTFDHPKVLKYLNHGQVFNRGVRGNCVVDRGGALRQRLRYHNQRRNRNQAQAVSKCGCHAYCAETA